MDLGGGSGVFARTLCRYFCSVHVVDIDTADAEKIKDYYNLVNLNIFAEDVYDFRCTCKYDLVIPADVLEHFEDLYVPIEFIRRSLKTNGLLMVSLPTENLIYSLRRKVIRRQKPEDHYHSSKPVRKFLSINGFRALRKSFVSTYVVPIPLFEIIVFEFESL